MGWTADALIDGKYLEPDRDSEVLAEFDRISEVLRKDYGGVDIFFPRGGLHLSTCKQAMTNATKRKIDQEVWLPDEVKQIYSASDWTEPTEATERMAF